MVDPDNRRPADYGLRARLLDDLTDGKRARAGPSGTVARRTIKIAAIARILHLRRDHPELFAAGDYAALTAERAKAEHACAFVRQRGEQAILVVAARFPAALEAAPDWTGTTLTLPDELVSIRWRDILTGTALEFADGVARAEIVLRHPPVAVLVRLG